MEFSIGEVENNPIIRKQFLQKLDNILFVEDHDTIIQNIIWLPEEIHKNMVYAYNGRHVNASILKQCLKFVKQFCNKYIPVLYIHPYIDNNINNLNINSCHYLIDNYPNQFSEYDLINFIEKEYPMIMQRLLKNNDLNYDNFYNIMYNIIEIQRMDHFILLPLNQYFIKSLSHNIRYIDNIDILDYVLNNFKIDYSSENLFELFKNFNYSVDIINRFMMHGFLDIHTIYTKKYRFKKCKFVKLLYYTLCIKNKDTADILSSYIVFDDDLYDNIKACIAAIKLLEHPDIMVNDIFIDQVIVHLYNFYNKEAVYIYEKII